MIPHPIFWGNSLPKNYGKQFFNPSTLCCQESCNYSFQKDFDQRFSLQFLHHLANDGNDDEHDNLGYYRGDKNDKEVGGAKHETVINIDVREPIALERLEL